ncbi:MAG: dihydropyrimidinase [Bdellovibrionota bacterium]
MAKYIRGGKIITASDTFIGEVLVNGSQIAAVGSDLRGIVPAGAEEIDATGLYVMPGGIDVHTHLDLPFMGTSSSDDFETGTIAAACGGTTSIIDFAIQEKGRTVTEALNKWHEKAAGKAVTDYGFHVAITDFNDKIASELPGVVRQGVTSFKCFMAYKGSLMIDDGQLFKLLSEARKLGALISLHCENGEIIDVLTKKFLGEGKTSPLYHELAHPAIGEGEATHRSIALSRMAGHPVYVVHMSCEESLKHVRESTLKNNHKVFAETCPQYLVLDRSVYEKPGFEGAKWVMSPPIRTRQDQEALWSGIRNGFIQVVATDHCPFNFSGQKDMGKDCFAKIPNGAPGIEDRLNILHTYGVLEGKISLNQFVEVTATNPARIFGMYPKKGTIAPGSDADIVLFDPTKESMISSKNSHHRCDYSAFEGFRLKGKPAGVLIRGAWALKDGDVKIKRGFGQFLKRDAIK